MAAHMIVAMSNPVEGQEAEFNRWYDEQHLKDVAAVSGVIGARRLQFAGGDGRWRSIALYDVESDAPEKVLEDIMSRVGTPMMPVSDALDKSSMFVGVFADSSAKS